MTVLTCQKISHLEHHLRCMLWVAACMYDICCNIAAQASPLLHAEDEEMKEMAQEETEKIRSQMQTLEAQLEILLLPKDPLDERSIMLEVFTKALFATTSQTAAFVFRAVTVAVPVHARPKTHIPILIHNHACIWMALVQHVWQWDALSVLSAALCNNLSTPSWEGSLHKTAAAAWDVNDSIKWQHSAHSIKLSTMLVFTCKLYNISSGTCCAAQMLGSGPVK